MTPNNQGPSVAPIIGDFLPPKDRQQVIRVSGGGGHYASSSAIPTDYSLGGVKLNDVSLGLSFQLWKFELKGQEVWAHPSFTKLDELLYVFTGTAPDEMSACFDGSMRQVITYQEAGTVRLYHYDGSIPAFVTSTFQGASPRLTFDDHRFLEVTLDAADVMLFYVHSGSCWYRQSRERFLEERFFCALPPQFLRLGRVGRSYVNRMQVEMLCEG
jgi:hypothetical protein